VPTASLYIFIGLFTGLKKQHFGASRSALFFADAAPRGVILFSENGRQSDKSAANGRLEREIGGLLSVDKVWR
jgi:hypothetical protein